MSRSFALRLLETFFRHWLLCLLPALLFIGLGVASVATAESKYVSKGVLYVESETLLSKLTGADTQNNGFQTPAQAASSRLTSLIGTDEFIRSIIDRGGLTDLVNAGIMTLDGVRASIGATPASPNTLHVWGSGVDPQIAFRLATATIDSFIQWVIDASLSDSTTAEQFLQTLAETYKADVQTAKFAFDAYVAAHPDPAVGARPTSEATELDRLRGDLTTAQTRYTSTLGKAEDARLASAQTRSNVAGRLRLVDAPKVPTVSTLSRKDLVLQFGMFVVLGFALSAAAVVVGTITDKSLRSAEEVRERLGVPLLAVVPESRISSRRRPGTDPTIDPESKRSRRRVKGEETANAEGSLQLEDHHAHI